MHASEILGPQGPFAQGIETYEHRPSQQAMADAVETILEHEGVALIEAGTGTGKTLAYLIPAIRSGRKVVISTGTKTLQDQIMEHDIPMIRQYLDHPVRAACMKGLNNYLCRRRHTEFLHRPEALNPDFSMAMEAIDQWSQRSQLGDRAEVRDISETHPIWGSVLSGPDTRIGRRCKYYEDCFVTHMRRAAEEAQIIVVNHHLFFADLATKGPHSGAVIPEYDAVIFDEAHQVEDVATLFFGAQVSSQKIRILVRDADRGLTFAKERSPAAEQLLRRVLNDAEQFFDSIPVGHLRENARVQLRTHELGETLRPRHHQLDTSLEALSLLCRRHGSEYEKLAQISRRTQKIRDDLATVIDSASESQVSWAERKGRSIAIGASPVDVSAIFREHVFQAIPSVVLTSATLSTSGSFKFIKQRLGIDFEVDENILPSPFAYEDQAALYLPDLDDPRQPQFQKQAIDEISRLVSLTEGGAFVLCTSKRMVNTLSAQTYPSWRYPIFVQGEAPKSELLQRFRKTGNAVLFATASFWEGVDVPGDALRLVIIDRLPFDVPSDPLVQARCQHLDARGERSFIRYVVPAAALTLKQGFGRLVRTRNDQGIVAILDSRIRRKGYGKTFLKSLPPARRCETFVEVEAFWSPRTEQQD